MNSITITVNNGIYGQSEVSCKPLNELFGIGRYGKGWAIYHFPSCKRLTEGPLRKEMLSRFKRLESSDVYNSCWIDWTSMDPFRDLDPSGSATKETFQQLVKICMGKTDDE